MKDLHYTDLKSANLLNSILKKFNYAQTGYTINKTGKWYLSKAVISRPIIERSDSMLCK